MPVTFLNMSFIWTAKMPVTDSHKLIVEASLWRISRQSVTIRCIDASARWLATNGFSYDYMLGCSAFKLMTTELSTL